MNKAIDLAGHAAAYLGVAVCLAAGIVRVLGNYDLAGFSIQSLFVGGMGLMIFACLAKLHMLTTK